MAHKRILVVEDDDAIRGAIVAALEHEGHTSIECCRGDEAMSVAVEADFDLLLLDVMLPGASGFDVLRRVRETRPKAPVIVLTARGEESDRVRGLRLGADDYVVKPFSRAELMARVDAVLRRSAERPTDVKALRLPGVAADLERRVVRFDDGGSAELTEREADLLRYLAMHPGRPISRAELLERVWRIGPDGAEQTRTIDMQVARLRDKLGSGGRLIRTVRGRGYVLDAGAPPSEGEGA